VVYEPEERPLERSRSRLPQSTDRAVSRGKMTADEADALKARIAYTSSLVGVDGVMEPWSRIRA
jgi:3-hydroxybutyryl-CoA dehydrogenase